MADKTLIQLNRFNRDNNNSNASGYELQDGEPIFDLKNNLLYIGTPSNKTVANLRNSGNYFRPVNENYPIKTSDIADAAVTTSKIFNGAIVTSKIANGSVTNEKLNLSDGGIGLDKINIPDRSISFSKISGNVPYDRISGAPTTVDASAITGKIKWENLPALEFTNNTMELNGATYGAALCAVHAYKDQRGSVIHKNYGSSLVVDTTATTLSLKSPDGTVLSSIPGSTLAQIVSYNSKDTTFNGSIYWRNIVDPPSILNMSGKIGDEMSPVYFDYDELSFKKCYDYGWLSERILSKATPKPDSVKTVGKSDVYTNVLSDYINVSGEYLIAYQMKMKNSSGTFWNTGVGYFNTNWTARQYFAYTAGYYGIYIEVTPSQYASNGKFRIVGNTNVNSGTQVAQIKYRLIKI